MAGLTFEQAEQGQGNTHNSRVNTERILDSSPSADAVEGALSRVVVTSLGDGREFDVEWIDSTLDGWVYQF